MQKAQRENQGKRHRVGESVMKRFVNQYTNYNWQTVIGTVNKYVNYLHRPFFTSLAPTRAGLLMLSGIDGMAIEIAGSVGGGGSIVGGDFTPLGASFFIPFHTGVPDSTNPHPVDDAPHFYLFSSIGVDVGATMGGSAGADAQVVFADHWDKPSGITVGSWSGSIISVDAEMSFAVKLGASVNATIYFSSVNPSAGLPFYGAALTEAIPDSGWHGAGLGGGITTGLEFEITGGITLTTTINGWLENIFDREDVAKAMKDMEKVPESGDMHYDPPSDPLSQFVSWFAGSSGVGEAVKQ